MKKIKKHLAAITFTLSLPFITSNVQFANAGVSNSTIQIDESVVAPKKVNLPEECLKEIGEIRTEFIKILSCESKTPIQSKRATIKIVPFESLPKTPVSPRRSVPTASSDGLGATHGSQIKIEQLTGYKPATDEIYVPCGALKLRMMRLISNPRRTLTQKLEIIKLLCAPCSTGQCLIDGDTAQLNNLNPDNLKKVEASLDASKNGTLLILCHRFAGDCIMLYI